MSWIIYMLITFGVMLILAIFYHFNILKRVMQILAVIGACIAFYFFNKAYASGEIHRLSEAIAIPITRFIQSTYESKTVQSLIKLQSNVHDRIEDIFDYAGEQQVRLLLFLGFIVVLIIVYFVLKGGDKKK